MSIKQSNASTAVIRRLPRYYRKMKELLEAGIDHISSKELAEQMGLTASQIRQDLNHFGGFGQYGYGYSISYLKDQLAKILGIDKTYRVIIVGAGYFGRAITAFPPTKHTYIIQAIFSNKPDLIGKTVGDAPVFDMQDLEIYLSEHPVDIAILTYPPSGAPEMAERLARAGVPGIWNFSSIDLKVSVPDVIIENVHLSDSLMTLSYYLNHK